MQKLWVQFPPSAWHIFSSISQYIVLKQVPQGSSTTVLIFSNSERLGVAALDNMTKDALVNYAAEFVLRAFSSGCVI